MCQHNHKRFHKRVLLNRAMTARHWEPLQATASRFDPTASHCEPLRAYTFATIVVKNIDKYVRLDQVDY